MGKGKVGIEGFERVAYLCRGINVDPGRLGSTRKSFADLAAGSKAPMNLHLKRHKSSTFSNIY